MYTVCSCVAFHSLWLYLFSVPLEESSAFLAIAPWAAPPPASAEACDTMPGDGDACTDVVPAPEAEGACVLAVSSQQEEREHLWQPLLRHAKNNNMHAVAESQSCV